MKGVQPFERSWLVPADTQRRRPSSLRDNLSSKHTASSCATPSPL